MIKKKLIQAAGILKELNIDMWIIFTRESSTLHDPCLSMLVGGNVTWQSAFILTKSGEKTAILGSLDVAAHKENGYWDNIIPYVEGIKEHLINYLEKQNPSSIAINYSMDDEMADGLTHGQYLLLGQILKDTKWASRLISSEKIVNKLRSRKLDLEIERIKKACDETTDLFSRLHEKLHTGMTEKEIAGVMVEIMESKGLKRAWDAEHCPAVFTGPESACAHSGPTDRIMEPGHLMNVDFGMRYKGYCSDLQRTWYCLKPGETQAPEIVQRAFDAVKYGIQAAFEYIKPGVTGKDVDARARNYIIEKGFDSYPHALGHQIGQQAHDGAGLLCPAWERYGKRADAVVEKRQCYTLEPRVTVPEYGVATLEDIIVVNDDGARYLSKPQKKLLLIEN